MKLHNNPDTLKEKNMEKIIHLLDLNTTFDSTCNFDKSVKKKLTTGGRSQPAQTIDTYVVDVCNQHPWCPPVGNLGVLLAR